MKDFEFTPESSQSKLLGGVVMPRELTDLSVWHQKPFDPAHALCDLYMLANTGPGTFRLKRGVVVDYEVGELLWSNKALAARWGWQRPSVEKFLCELEKSEIIRRRNIDQYGKIIILTEFNTGTDSGTARHYSPEPTAEPPAIIHRNRQPLSTVGVLELGVGIGEGGAEPPRVVTLEQALKWFLDQGSGYDPDLIREQWLYYDAQRNPETGEWQKPRGNLGHMTPVSDWRSELSRACVRFGQKKNAPGQPNGKPSRSPAQARFELSKELKAVQDRLESAYETGAPLDTRDQTREKEIEHELNQLQEGAA